MISLELYKDISQRIRKLPVSDLPDVAIIYNVDHNTVLSIYSQNQQIIAKRASTVLKTHAMSITKKWFEGAPAADLADQYNVPLSLLVRTLISTLSSNYRSLQQHSSSPDGTAHNSSSSLNARLKPTPSRAVTPLSSAAVTLKPSIPYLPINVSSKMLTQILTFPAALYKVSQRLCADAFAALLSSELVTPGAARIRHHFGEDYERVLWQRLAALGIPFIADAEMRQKRQAKTPDARLLVPLTLYGRRVHWIESKAAFGDPRTHQQYLQQLLSYTIRYGPGAVVYWSGCVLELNTRPTELLARLREEQRVLAGDGEDDGHGHGPGAGQEMVHECVVPVVGEGDGWHWVEGALPCTETVGVTQTISAAEIEHVSADDDDEDEWVGAMLQAQQHRAAALRAYDKHLVEVCEARARLERELAEAEEARTVVLSARSARGKGGREGDGPLSTGGESGEESRREVEGGKVDRENEREMGRRLIAPVRSQTTGSGDGGTNGRREADTFNGREQPQRTAVCIPLVHAPAHKFGVASSAVGIGAAGQGLSGRERGWGARDTGNQHRDAAVEDQVANLAHPDILVLAELPPLLLLPYGA